MIYADELLRSNCLTFVRMKKFTARVRARVVTMQHVSVSMCVVCAGIDSYESHLNVLKHTVEFCRYGISQFFVLGHSERARDILNNIYVCRLSLSARFDHLLRDRDG